MAYSTRRYSYDDDSASAQGLWVVVLVVAAMVGSFLFGRYVLGERLKPSASPVRNADSGVVPGATAGAAATVQPGQTASPVSIVPEAAPVDATPTPSPDAQATLNAAIERARTGELTPEPEEPATGADADRRAAEQRRALQEANDRKKKEEEARRKKEKEEQARREAAARAAAKPKPEAQPPAATAKPKPAARPAPPPLAPGEKPQPNAAPDPTQATPPTAPDEAKPEAVNYRVRVGTFSTADQAAQRQADLKAKGHDAYVRVRSQGGRTVYDVQAGAFEDQQNAQAKADELRSDGFSAETTSSR